MRSPGGNDYFDWFSGQIFLDRRSRRSKVLQEQSSICCGVGQRTLYTALCLLKRVRSC